MGCQHLAHSGTLPSILYCGCQCKICVCLEDGQCHEQGNVCCCIASLPTTEDVCEISMTHFSSCSHQQAQRASVLCCAGRPAFSLHWR